MSILILRHCVAFAFAFVCSVLLLLFLAFYIMFVFVFDKRFICFAHYTHLCDVYGAISSELAIIIRIDIIRMHDS